MCLKKAPSNLRFINIKIIIRGTLKFIFSFSSKKRHGTWLKRRILLTRLWGGRFESGVNDLAQSYSASIDIDKRLFEVDIKGSIAYAEALRKAKLISAIELTKIKQGLKKVSQEIHQNKFDWDPSLEDVHMNIESRLVKIAGEAAKKIHTGRSRNDQVATDLKLFSVSYTHLTLPTR